tara:strand:+ start:888 stop:2699 length:1812 start_codon:yes stop_codon:yes gene_type:complete
MTCISKTAFFLLLSFCLVFKADSKPQHAIALGSTPKYHSGFKHFKYVNPNAPKGGSLRFGVLGTFDSLNPFVVKGSPAAGLGLLHNSYTFATLLRASHDEPFSRYGYVAETIDIAEDHLSVTFKLREKATFHDGSPITPEDVIFTFKTLVTKGHPLYKAYYADVKSVTSPGKGLVRFSFKTSKNKELPLILGEIPLLSKASFHKRPFEEASLTPLLGSGPYKIKEADAGRSITYERVQNWWGSALPVSVGHYNFDTITYDYYRDSSVAFEAFKSGDYDLRIENEARHWATGYTALVKSGEIQKLEIQIENPEPMQGLIFNTRRDLFKDRQVRRALTYALDFEWMNENLFYNLYARTKSYFEASELAAKGLPQGKELEILNSYKNKIPPEVFTTPYTLPKTDGSGRLRRNLSHGKKLLEKAGYTIEKGVLVHTKTKTPFSFEILIVQPAMERILHGFINNLKRLGITARLRLVDSSQYVSRVDLFDYDMIVGMLAQSLSPGNEQREFWESSRADLPGSRNYAGIKDMVVDELIEHLNDASNRDDLVQITRALDRVLLWGHYLIPMYHNPKTFIALRKTIAYPATFPKYNIALDSWWSTQPQGGS